MLDLRIVPKKFFKRISGSKGLFEIRVKHGSNDFRIFCFLDGNHLVLINCFRKKDKKTPQHEIILAERLKKEYYEEKNQGKKFRSITKQ
jgi:phage-related protein